MADEDWNTWHTRCLGLQLAGDAIDELDVRGKRIVDQTLLILLNAHYEPIPFVLPAQQTQVQWEEIVNTQEATGRRRHRLLYGGEAYVLEARSLALLRLYRGGELGRESDMMRVDDY
jgi:glycogen operon protein